MRSTPHAKGLIEGRVAVCAVARPILTMETEKKAGLSREFVVKSVLRILDTAEREKAWGSVTVQYQAGACRVIKEEKTTTREERE